MLDSPVFWAIAFALDTACFILMVRETYHNLISVLVTMMCAVGAVLAAYWFAQAEGWIR